MFQETVFDFFKDVVYYYLFSS